MRNKMKKGTKKCKNCGRWNSPFISFYYRGKIDGVSCVKKRKTPLMISRKICSFCNKKIDGEVKK
jgi:hypothetical protein